jgi:hypothetical protein
LRPLRIWLILAGDIVYSYIGETNWGGLNNTLGIFYACRVVLEIPIALVSFHPGYLLTHPLPKRGHPIGQLAPNHYFLSDRRRTAVCPIGPDETPTVCRPHIAPFAWTSARLPQRAALWAAQQSSGVAPSRRAGPLRVGCACCRGANAS